jgi:serum/glucocorticoid-regulated kinase 2
VKPDTSSITANAWRVTEPEIIPVTSQNSLEPGVLRVAIHEGLGLSVPQSEAALEHGNGPSSITSQSEGGLISPLSDHGGLLYATLELGGFEISVSATSGTRENPVWSTKLGNRIHEKKFDIFRAAELTVRLYAKNPDHREGSQDALFLGCAKMNPVFGDEVQTEWLPIKNGTGKLHVEVEYVKMKTLRIETKRSGSVGQSRLGSVARFRNSGSNSCYAAIHIQKADLSPRCDVMQALLLPVNNGPFIAPLDFIAQTRSHFCLFWPFVSGGHLFYHLQRAQRFHADRARLYAAEILVALEWLDEVDPSYHELRPKNILLDSVGHVVICDLGLLHLEMKNVETTSDSAGVDYLAPELLAGNASAPTDTTASKWWTLGVFLFEMLTGLPPFYDEDVEQRCRNILSEPLVVSGLLLASTQDLLNKLLTRKPDDRLGFNGASEIRAHRYFDGLDWDKVAWREYEPEFKPHELAMRFVQEGKRETIESVIASFAGFSWGTPTPVQRDPAVPAAVESHPVANEKTEDWELVWQRQDQSFYFYNRSTKTKKPIVAARPYLLKRPDKTQEALGAVLKNKYMHLVPKMLEEYSVNLNFELDFRQTSPLNYVTELQEVDIVRLFLANGADANLEPGSTLGGQPLLSAVQKGNQELVQMLVQRTDRIPCTRALGHAVSKQDTPIINILLANGVKCDFEEADRPKPAGNWNCNGDFDDMNATMGDASKPEEYMPSLVRAIGLGDADLVRLLLAHGANVNVGYHDSSILLPGGILYRFGHTYMECGRPIQLAMELGHEDLVRPLLENGADIGLPQPVWRHHVCKMIPREVHHQLTARLRSIAASIA